jgi:hypothetical protein
MNTKLTTASVQRGNFNGVMPEFGRTKDVEQIYGIKRGTLYNLHKQGRIRAVLLRVKGKQNGIKLWDLSSIHNLIQSAMELNEMKLHEKELAKLDDEFRDVLEPDASAPREEDSMI